VVQLVAQRITSLRPSPHGATAIWAAVVATGTTIGWLLIALDRHIVLPTPPILAEIGPGLRTGALLPAAVATLFIASYRTLIDTLSWRALCAIVPLVATTWTVSLALAEGTSGLTRGPKWSTEYLSDVPSVRAGPAGFLRGFTDNIERYEIHVRGHPPGMVLLLAGLDRVGLGGAAPEAVLVIALAATAPVAVMLVVRVVAGEAMARRSIPWLVLTPAAIWIATSADALYMTVGAWAVALVILSVDRRAAAGVFMAASGGLLGGLALLGTYGIVLVATVPIAVMWSRRRDSRAVVRSAAVATASAGVVIASLIPFGFWWFDGLRTTKHEYDTLDLDRPYWAFIFVNLAAWSLALGPATFMALARLRDRRVWTVVGGGIAAAMLANASGLSLGEVERIWLPFTLWVLPAGAALTSDLRLARAGLALQAVSSIALISVATTQW
jgi:methylthioxylose transferase